MSEPEDTRFDRFLDNHPKLDKFYMYKWSPIEVKIKWYLHVPSVIQDYRWRRQFKPGSFYKDHNYEPMILIELEKKYGTVRGISLFDGREVNSDLYACDPRPCTEKEAREQLKVVQADKEKVNA